MEKEDLKKKELQIRIDTITQQQIFKKKFPHTSLKGVFMERFPWYKEGEKPNTFHHAIYGRIADQDVLDKLIFLNKKK